MLTSQLSCTCAKNRLVVALNDSYIQYFVCIIKLYKIIIIKFEEKMMKAVAN